MGSAYVEVFEIYAGCVVGPCFIGQRMLEPLAIETAFLVGISCIIKAMSVCDK